MLSGGKTIPLPKGEVGKVAAKLVSKFRSCSISGEVSNKVAPPPDYQANCTRFEAPFRPEKPGLKQRYKEGGTIHTCTENKVARSWLSKGKLIISGYYSPSGKQVRVQVNPDACAEPERWKEEIRTILRHEFTHAADPYVHVRKTNYSKLQDDLDECAYLNDPVEVTAQLAEVEEELLSAKTRLAILRSARHGYPGSGRLHEVLHESPTYLKRLSCVTPKINRRFFQLAARLWQSGKLGPRPE